LTVLALVAALVLAPAQCSTKGPCDLRGRVRFVEYETQADWRVYIEASEAVADMRIRWIDGGALRPGEWHVVQRYANFTVWIAPNRQSADFTIATTRGRPGC